MLTFEFFLKRDFSASNSLLNTQRDVEPSSYSLRFSYGAANGRWSGEKEEQGKLGVPTRIIYSLDYIEHGYIEDHTTTWENAHNVTPGEESRIQGYDLGYDQSNIKYEEMWIKTKRRLRKVKIVDLGSVIYKFLFFSFLPLFSFLYTYTAILIK